MNLSTWSLLITPVLNNTSTEWSINTSNDLFSTNMNAQAPLILGKDLAIIISILIFLSPFISSLLTHKMHIKWSAKADKKLEEYKAEINHNNSIFYKILDSYTNEFKFTQEKRIKAADILWEKTLEARELGKIPHFFYDTVYESEFDSIFDNKNIVVMLKPLNDLVIFEKINLFLTEVEKYRPYMGEYLWILFWTYLRFIGRVGFVLKKGIDEKKIIMWYKDEFLCSILNVVFSEEGTRSIYTTSDEPFLATTEKFEKKILEEIEKLVSGRLASENCIDQVLKLRKILSNKTEETKYLTDFQEKIGAVDSEK